MGLVLDMYALTDCSIAVNLALSNPYSLSDPRLQVNPFPLASYTKAFSLSNRTLYPASHNLPIEIKLDDSCGVWIASLNFKVIPSP